MRSLLLASCGFLFAAAPAVGCAQSCKSGMTADVAAKLMSLRAHVKKVGLSDTDKATVKGKKDKAKFDGAKIVDDTARKLKDRLVPVDPGSATSDETRRLTETVELLANVVPSDSDDRLVYARFVDEGIILLGDPDFKLYIDKKAENAFKKDIDQGAAALKADRKFLTALEKKFAEIDENARQDYEEARAIENTVLETDLLDGQQDVRRAGMLFGPEVGAAYYHNLGQVGVSARVFADWMWGKIQHLENDDDKLSWGVGFEAGVHWIVSQNVRVGALAGVRYGAFNAKKVSEDTTSTTDGDKDKSSEYARKNIWMPFVGVEFCVSVSENSSVFMAGKYYFPVKSKLDKEDQGFDKAQSKLLRPVNGEAKEMAIDGFSLSVGYRYTFA